ncbi:C26 family cysteine hydrolase domain-containing family [Candidatus Woesearchaeota archaeon]|jgi:gamma-glutamyl-gamma-aminobutyrate hydrolase PuuD|nr:C26 family cysteine hydrolase domain-containing family [Candidatus Woesearchaeota archaeon]MBT5342125.1 C26 family cysteine hydrolase domain-containing family [Candidatus Woesearchaeota archaeon]
MNDKRIRLAITPRHLENRDGEFFSVQKNYLDFWSSYGYELILIPFIEDMDFESFFNELGIKGLLIAGGYKYYSEKIRGFEHKVISAALNKKLPIIGVCCGLWSINGFFGGKLKWNERHSKRNIKFVSHFLYNKILGRKYIPKHKIFLTGDIINKCEAEVNSYHRKVVSKLGDGLKPFILSDDGEIEGIYNLEKKIIAVQFHFEHGNCSKWLEIDCINYINNLFNFKNNGE